MAGSTERKAWVKAPPPLSNGKEASVNMSELLEQNRQLGKQNARLEQKKAILKKAAAYFAKESV